MKKRKKGRRRLLYVVIVIVAVVIAFVIYGLVTQDNRIHVRYIYAQRRTIVQTVVASGRIQPMVEIKISPEVSGEITELPIIEGEKVKKGDLLCRIRPDRYVSLVDQARARLNSAITQKKQSEDRLRQAALTYERTKRLHQQKVVSDADMDRATTDYNLAKNDAQNAGFSVESMQAALKEAQENLSRTTIFSPADANISKLSVELGERVVGTAQMAGTELMRLADLAKMEARVDVTEADIAMVKLGDSTDITLDAFPDEIFKGVVSQIANSANSTVTADQITNFQVRIAVLPESYAELKSKTGGNPLKPGMSVSVKIRTKVVRNALSLPLEAVTVRLDSAGYPENTASSVTEDKKPLEVIFFVKAGEEKGRQIAGMTFVKTGIQDNTYIQIKSELEDSLRVIAWPYSALTRTLYPGIEISASKQRD